MKRNLTIITGLALFLLGGLTIFLEQITDWGVSKLIGKLYCGERYLQAAGQPGDGMCGFNMDMVVGMASFLLVLAGLLLLLIGLVKFIVRRRKNRPST